MRLFKLLSQRCENFFSREFLCKLFSMCNLDIFCLLLQLDALKARLAYLETQLYQNDASGRSSEGDNDLYILFFLLFFFFFSFLLYYSLHYMSAYFLYIGCVSKIFNVQGVMSHLAYQIKMHLERQ